MSWPRFSLLCDGKRHVGEREKGRSNVAELWIGGDIFVRIKLKPVKDHRANRVLYFPSILRPQLFVHGDDMVAIPVVC